MVDVGDLSIGESGRDQAVLKTGRVANPACFPVYLKSAASDRREKFATRSVQHHPDRESVSIAKGDAHGIGRNPVHEVRRAVDGIDDPLKTTVMA